MSDHDKIDEPVIQSDNRTEEATLTLTGAKKKPRLRNVKVTRATKDNPIYSYGFVIGGDSVPPSRRQGGDE